MNLSDATVLLNDQGRFFSELYKHFNYRDDQLLKDYLDFVIHEPAEWLKGFPTKLTKPGTFAKPKTALIKLLKKDEVKAVLDAEYLVKVHDIVWQTFKTHADGILQSRQQREHEQAENTGQKRQQNDVQIHMNTIETCEADSVLSAPKDDWERRYRILETVVRGLVNDYKDTNPGLTAATLTLLQSLSY